MERKILAIGIGQTGCSVAELFSNKMNKDGSKITAIAIDTDIDVLDTAVAAEPISLTNDGTLESVVETLGYEAVRDWFPCDWETDHTDFAKCLFMDRGSNQWRMKAYLSFVAFMSDEKTSVKLTRRLDEIAESLQEGDELHLCVVASLAGGTGSGLFLPVSLYIKKYFSEKGIKVDSSNAVLTMPDIYENCYNPEQRRKSCANAYAALREYNAVVYCAGIDGNAEAEETCSPVTFKLGSEDSPLGVLFDSKSSQFRGAAANPFDKVYLFDRIPGVVTVNVHVDIISNIIASMYKCEALSDAPNQKNGKRSDAIFAGASLVNVRYPLDCTVEYITQKYNYDFTLRELSFIHNIVMNDTKRRRGEARAYGMRFVENTEQYCDSFISVSGDKLHESESSLSLLGYSADSELEIGESEALWNVTSCISKLIDAVNLTFDCEEAKMLRDTWERIEKKESQKRPTRAENLAFIRQRGEWLTEFYKKIIKKVSESKEELVGILRDGNAGTISFVDAIVTNNGGYMHPAYALLRLCLTYKELLQMTSGLKMSFEVCSDPDGAELPEFLFSKASAHKRRTKYAKECEFRFDRVINDQEKDALKLADDRELFVEDLSQVYKDFNSSFTHNLCDIAMELVEDLINEYRGLIDAALNIKYDLAEEIKRAADKGTSSVGNMINVGASKEDKESAYLVYKKDYLEDEDAVLDSFEALGRSVFAQATDGKGAYKERVETILREMGSMCEGRLKKSAFYKEQLDKNIMSAVCDLHNKREITLSKAFKGRDVPLRYRLADDHKNYKFVKTVTDALIDSSVEAYMTEHPERFGNKDPGDYIVELMCFAGENNGRAIFTDGFSPKELLLRRVVSNLRMHYVDFIGETDNSANGYRNYKAAMDNVVRYDTQMWNPHVVYDRKEGMTLPFIDPVKQKEYDLNVVKALMYATHVGEVRTSRSARAGTKYKISNIPIHYLTCENDHTEVSLELKDMIEWIYRHPSWALDHAELFDAAFNKDVDKIAYAMITESSTAERIASSNTAALLRGAFVKLVADLCEKDDSCLRGYLIRMAEVAYSSVVSMCKKGFSEFDLEYTTVHNEQTRAIVSAIAEAIPETAKPLIKEFNSRGLFKTYNKFGELGDYS